MPLNVVLAQGWIHNYYFESKTEFSSLDQMLLGIDDILDRAGECQRDTRLRTTFKKEPTVKHTSMGDEQFADYLTSSMAERMPPAFNPDIDNRNKDEWSGFADLLANLIEKYAAVLDIENLPEPPVCLDDTKAQIEDKSKLFAKSVDKTGNA